METSEMNLMPQIDTSLATVYTKTNLVLIIRLHGPEHNPPIISTKQQNIPKCDRASTGERNAHESSMLSKNTWSFWGR